MKMPKAEKINLPYASSVASYFADQGAVQGSSFLGKMFKGGGRVQQTQNQGAPAAAGVAATRPLGMMNKAGV